ncbi:hypothetical protein [Lichenibacterium dinghuense]|uniref:PIN-like domain-containing protein n=1 Tax=Lichenibacterium dinghuense TaxID=2895977 RepID=UPI001F47FF74|nr:hypothetical protein [Lichenibacterium sp. 6Y81]
MRIFVDNCISHVVASTLNGYVAHLGHDAVHVRDLPCGPHATDVVWMATLRATGDDWLVLTGDVRISRNRPERLAFTQCNLKGIALAPSFQTMPMHQRASTILWRWPDIENAAARFQPPFLFELPVGRGTGLRMLRL